jgi:hypothetical protein
MPSISNLDDRRRGKSRTVSSIQAIPEREMMTRAKPHAAFLSIALGLMLTPVVSGTQRSDIDADAAAKALASREAFTHSPIRWTIMTTPVLVFETHRLRFGIGRL